MTYKTFRQYCIDTKVVSIAKSIRENANKYPYITVLRDGNVAENIYFSKSSATQVTVGSLTKSIANDLFIADAVNADGEARTKLSFNNSYDAMEDMFA